MRRSGIFSFPIFVFTVAAAFGQVPARTDQHAWQPNHFAEHAENYAGAQACASCHPAKARNQGESEMGLSVLRPADDTVLIAHPAMSFVRGNYTYSLSKQGDKVIFTATDGKDTITEPVFAAVGSGNVFQAYLIQHNGQWHRAPVDYFAAQGKLGADPDASKEMPAGLDSALGASLNADNVRGCFQCHSPVNVIGGNLDVTSQTPGIRCETCHGPGAKHVAQARRGKPHDAEMFNPAHSTPQAQAEFCNSCHVSAANMKKQNPPGTRSVTSEDLRLQTSRCWNAADKRIGCVACHDSHAPMEQSTAAYDSKCLACHTVRGGAAQADHPGKSCPKATSDCAGCHMPKVVVPNTSILYADHRIRIARAGAPFPE